ncbi:MAG: YceI family protein [Sandaracinaceae bacterium]|nr:YceI family protein [Sandaracinaceae bacterium]
MRVRLNKPGLVVISFALLTVASVAYAAARDFAVTNQGGSRIQFVSDAPLETITGVSSNVTGTVHIDPANLAGATGRVAVRVDSIRTGIDLRDEHLRSDTWLNAARFPEAAFVLTRIEGATSLSPNQTANVTLHGRFTIHGVTRETTAQAQLRYVPVTDQMRTNHITGDALRVQANFRIRMSDYGVSIPSVVQLKVANELEVNVTLRATAP